MRASTYSMTYTNTSTRTNGGGDNSGWAEEGREASSRRPILGEAGVGAAAAVPRLRQRLARGRGIGFSVSVRRCARRASVWRRRPGPGERVMGRKQSTAAATATLRARSPVSPRARTHNRAHQAHDSTRRQLTARWGVERSDRACESASGDGVGRSGRWVGDGARSRRAFTVDGRWRGDGVRGRVRRGAPHRRRRAATMADDQWAGDAAGSARAVTASFAGPVRLVAPRRVVRHLSVGSLRGRPSNVSRRPCARYRGPSRRRVLVRRHVAIFSFEFIVVLHIFFFFNAVVFTLTSHEPDRRTKRIYI